MIVFNQVTLDGYFTGATATSAGLTRIRTMPEWNAFVADNASGGGQLLFGRITYRDHGELLADAAWRSRIIPIVAERMNHMPKVVFSRTLDKASWNNTKLVKGGHGGRKCER